MRYEGYFRDISGKQYTVEIYTPSGGIYYHQITLAGEPVIINTESNGLFSPIKPKTATIKIMTEPSFPGFFDLYTTDPQGVKVKIYESGLSPVVVFKGYATPMQYGQDWTSIDVLTLECVDCISSLKSIPYTMFNSAYGKQYLPIDELICHVLGHMADDATDWVRWDWPIVNYKGANSYTWSYTYQFLHNIKLSEANFFDDDDEHTPWTFYQVLEEICRYFGVTATSYGNHVMFIDYLYAASSAGTYGTYVFDLDLNRTQTSYTKSVTWNIGNYAGGTASIETDDYYNVISMSTNRYNINELCPDLLDHDGNHISITKERWFNGVMQVWTHTTESGWWIFGSTKKKRKYAYKTYCRIKPSTGWYHTWYRPSSFANINPTMFDSSIPAEVRGYYDPVDHELAASWNNTPENIYINTVGATFVHYAVCENIAAKPTKLDWNDVIMFQNTTATFSTGMTGVIRYGDLFDDTLYRPVLRYEGDEEICFSPKDGKSWIVLSCKLWYQQNVVNGKDSLSPTNTDAHKQTMFPIEDVTDWEPYAGILQLDPGHISIWTRPMTDASYGNGWSLVRMAVQVGDKYWDGSAWTTTQSTFYLKFTSEYEGDKYTYNGESQTTYDAFQYLKWLDCASNTTYEDQVGKEGYCIPIERSDGVSGKIKIYIYPPRQIPLENRQPTTYNNIPFAWYAITPIVFMKDFKVDYVYTADTEWYLNEEVKSDDIKYNNSTNDDYVYDKDNTLKINSWQQKRPIAKSFPIVDFTQSGSLKKEYVKDIYDEYYISEDPQKPVRVEQEYNLIQRYLRHYDEPRLIYKANRQYPSKPWDKVELAPSADLDDKLFVVDEQEFDLRNRNCKVKLIEFGDITTP